MSDALLAEARELLASGEGDEALAIALRLSEAGSAEALALALQALGQSDQIARALEVAEEFSAAYPQGARGWELLGNACSLSGDLSAALRAYARASSLEDVDLQRLACARASAYLAAGDHAGLDAALAELGPDSPYLVRGAILRLQSCNQRGAQREGLDFVAAALQGRQLSAPPAELAWLMVEEGHARLALGEREPAARCALRAAALDRGNKGALFVLREALDLRSAIAHRYRLQVVGALAPELGGGRFTAAYEVVADEPSEALGLCQPLEPGVVELGLSAFEKGEPAPELPKGVYARSGREPAS